VQLYFLHHFYSIQSYSFLKSLTLPVEDLQLIPSPFLGCGGLPPLLLEISQVWPTTLLGTKASQVHQAAMNIQFMH